MSKPKASQSTVDAFLKALYKVAETHQCSYKRKVALKASLPRKKLGGQRPPPEPCSICQALRERGMGGKNHADKG